MRGSISAWENLNLTPEKINDDTLYFIYESATNTKEGKLYLGQKLISGVGGSNSGTGNININDIGDVDIGSKIPLADYQILVYNDTSEKWENASLSTIINTKISEISVFIGAIKGENGNPNIAGVAGIVPAPPAGAHDKFLKGDGTWAFTPTPTFNSDIFSINNNEVDLNGFSSTSIGSIPIKTNAGLDWISLPAGRLNREIITMEELNARINGTSSIPANTDTIYMIANGNDPSTENTYDEYMIIGNRLERLGTFGQVDLTNYVTNSTFQSTISVLNNILYDTVNSDTGKTDPGLINRVSTIENNYITQTQIGNLSDLILSAGNTNLVEEVNTINVELDELSERLLWHELSASSDNN